MKIVAVLDVDEKVLAETGHSFEEEIGCASQSGIVLKEYAEADKCSEYEYAAFAWNIKEQKYEQVGRPVMTEQLCRARYEEHADNGWFMSHYDAEKTMFKKRLVSTLYSEWEDM